MIALFMLGPHGYVVIAGWNRISSNSMIFLYDCYSSPVSQHNLGVVCANFGFGMRRMTICRYPLVDVGAKSASKSVGAKNNGTTLFRTPTPAAQRRNDGQ